MLERLTGWGAVAIWGTFNAFLVGLLAGFILGGFGTSPFLLETYGSSAGLVFLIALAVWLGQRYRPWQRGWRQPAGAASVILFAIAAILAWLGLAFGIWITIIAAFPLLAALLLEYAIHRRKSQRPAAPADRAGQVHLAGSGHYDERLRQGRCRDCRALSPAA
jgi:hypothetical protein